MGVGSEGFCVYIYIYIFVKVFKDYFNVLDILF